MSTDFQNSVAPQIIERRQRVDDALLLHIEALQESNKQLQLSHKELVAKMNYHYSVFEERVELAVKGVFERAFPEGDPEGHRAFHDALIKKAENQAKFWNEMVLAGAKWMGLGVLGFVATAVWIAIKSKVNQ